MPDEERDAFRTEPGLDYAGNARGLVDARLGEVLNKAHAEHERAPSAEAELEAAE